MAELTSFVRSNMPPVIKVVGLKNDPPVPMPNTAPGSNAWLNNVRLTFAPVEDELGAPPAAGCPSLQRDGGGTQQLGCLEPSLRPVALRQPLSRLHAWTRSRPPLRSCSPSSSTRTVRSPRFTASWGPSGRWTTGCSRSIDLALPEDNGRFRSSFTGPILIQGEPATDRFMAAAKAAIAQAKPKKEAIERAYRNDLLKATQPGTLYKGKMSYRGKTHACRGAHLPPRPGGDPNIAQFELRLPASGYVYSCSAKLAKGVPNMPVPAARIDDTSFRWSNPRRRTI